MMRVLWLAIVLSCTVMLTLFRFPFVSWLRDLVKNYSHGVWAEREDKLAALVSVNVGKTNFVENGFGIRCTFCLIQ